MPRPTTTGWLCHLFTLLAAVGAGTAGADTPWSLAPLVRHAVPPGESHPIDAFIRARLAEKGIALAPPADPRSLLRRLHYDLTGLPPTIDDVEAFTAEVAARGTGEATNSAIERLLASPRHGEHLARHWLDAAHYADTHGNDHDHARPNAWPYRDWVIGAFNDDKPYDRFIAEQVAGDVLFPDDPQAIAALGFLAAGPWDDTLMVGVREDTVDHLMSQNLDRDDYVTTVMSTFQSLTVHCARCHDHKFDPVSQRDYHALQAVFAGIDRADRPYDTDPATHARRRELLARRAAIERREPSILAALASPPETARLAAVAEALRTRAERFAPIEIIAVTSASSAGTIHTPLPDGSWLASGPTPEKDTILVTAKTSLRDLRAIRLETLADPSLPGGGPGRYQPAGNFHLTEFAVAARPLGSAIEPAAALVIARAAADHADTSDPVSGTLDGQTNTNWSVHPRYGENHEAVFHLAEPLLTDEGAILTIRLDHQGATGHQVGRLRLSACGPDLAPPLRDPPAAALASLLAKPAAERTTEETETLHLELLRAELEVEIAALPAPAKVYAVTNDFQPQGSFKPAKTPRPIRLLDRGEVTKPLEDVGPAALSCLPELPPDLVLQSDDEGARRAALAGFLVDHRNVLTWRSIVNRVWQWHFGRGLVDSPNDFGFMGSEPSHPELLDWLACWFRDDAKGSLKALHRLILSSATWQAAASSDPHAAAIDPDNRLLWRAHRRRLSGEQVRDTIVGLGDGLDLTMGGPAVIHFLDKGKATFMPDGGAPAFLDYEHFPAESPAHRRRAIYRFVFRTVPDPFMDALDVPDGGQLVPVRNESTTAVQALALGNDPLVLHQAARIAARLRATATDARPATDDERIDALFRHLLLRMPSAEERALLAGYAARHGLAAAAHLLLTTNEFLYLD
jgi:hypothetical protein